MKQFEVGKTYACRSLGDYDCIHAFKILARTDKTITTTTWSTGGQPVRRRISVWGGVERFKPFGSYSMCAVISADDHSIELARNAEAELSDV
jgi:hypothetical protein